MDIQQDRTSLGKVLITGIAGFIGSHVAEKFMWAGWDVYGIDNLSSGKFENAKTSFSVIDILEWGVVEQVFKEFEPDVVIHLAGHSSISLAQEKPILDVETSIIGTLGLIGFSNMCKQFVFASSSAVYHPTQKLPIKEGGKLYPESNYGMSKLAAEHYVLNNKVVKPTVLRFANVYGPRQDASGDNKLIPHILSHIYQGKEFAIYGDGNQLRDYVYVTDVADAIFASVKHGLEGVFNVSTNIGTTTNDLVNIVKAETGFPNDIPHVEAKDRRNVILNNIKISPWWTPKVFLHKGIHETVKAWEK